MKTKHTPPYVSIAQIGNCKICGEEKDLRCGACFQCMAQVAGEKVSATTHKLWDSKDPPNIWYYSETGH